MNLINKKRLFFLVFLLVIFITIPILKSAINSVIYWPTVEIAVDNVKNGHYKHMTTVYGREGIVYITLDDSAEIRMHNFYVRETDSGVLYGVAEEYGLLYKENFMRKINTAPDSTEQIVVGVGGNLASECAQKTGLKPNFVEFEDAGKKYTIWYILSYDMLETLPELQMGDVAFEQVHSWKNYIGPAIFLSIAIVIILIVRYRKRKKNTANQ